MKIRGIIPLLLALVLCVSVCACGAAAKEGNESSAETIEPAETTESQEQTETEQPTETQTMSWGDWTIDVPGGFELKGGDFLDETDPRYFKVKKSDFSYFDFKADGEERIMSNYNYNKETYTNEQEDVNSTFGGNEWIGFQYSDGFGGYGFEAYTTIDGEMIRVSSAGFAFDEDVVDTILSSLKHTTTEAAAPETEVSEEGASEETTSKESASAESASAETVPEEGAPVYAVVLEFKDVYLGVKEGYTEKKNATPAQYVMENDETGGKVSVWNSSGTAEDAVAKTMSGTEYEQREEDINGMHWVIATRDGFYSFATTIGDNVFQITIDYGATDDEMQDFIFGVTPKN